MIKAYNTLFNVDLVADTEEERIKLIGLLNKEKVPFVDAPGYEEV